MGRKILAILAGIVSALVVIAAIEFASHLVYTPLADMDMNDPGAAQQFIADLPVGAFLSELLAYGAATFVGGWVACRVAKEKPLRYAGGIGAVVMLAALANSIMIPHPLWFTFAVIVLMPLMAAVASRVAASSAGQAG